MRWYIDKEKAEAMRRIGYLIAEIKKAFAQYRATKSNQIDLQCELNSNIAQMSNEMNYLALKYNVRILY